MNYLIMFCFFIGLIFRLMDMSGKIFNADKLHRKNIDKFKNYVPLKELRYQINNLQDFEKVKILKKYYHYRIASRVLISLAFFLLVVNGIFL